MEPGEIMLRYLLSMLIIAVLSIPAAAQEIPPVERILVPLLGTYHGRYGTIWVTDLVAGNPTDEKIVFAQGAPFCQLSAGCPPPPLGLEPHEVQVFEGGGPDHPPYFAGRIFVVEKDHATRVQMVLRTRDTSRTEQTWGTTIPVALEREWFTEPFLLLDVPTDPRFRQALRVYDPDATDRGEVVVHFLDAGSGVQLATRRLFLLSGGRLENEQWYTFTSGAQILDLVGNIPELRAAERLTIRVEPMTPGLRVWGFVSVTNHVTQEVTVIAP